MLRGGHERRSINWKRNQRAGSGKCGGSGEPCFRGDICGFRPFAGVDFFAVGGLDAGNLEAAIGADNGEPVRFDSGDFTELAANAFRVLRRDRLGVENPQLLAVERRPCAGCRIAAADEPVDLLPRFAPVDLRFFRRAASFVGGFRFILLDVGRLAGLHQVDAFEHGLDAHRKETVEINGATGVGTGNRRLLLHENVAGIEAVVGPENRKPGLFLSLDDRPVDGTGAAVCRQQRGVILDRSVRRDIEKIFRYKQRDEGHDLQVGLEGLELFPDFWVLVGGRLIDRELGSNCGFLEWIGFGAFFFRRHVDRDDVIPALEQRFQHSLAEGLLAVNDDTHFTLLFRSCPRKRASSVFDVWVPAVAETNGLRCLFFLLRRAESAGVLDLRNVFCRELEHVLQDLVGVLAKQRRALHLGDRVRQFDRITDGQVLAARRMIYLDDSSGLAQRGLLGDFLHRQDRTDGDIDLVADLHDLELGLGHGPLLDPLKDLFELRQSRARRGVVRIGLPGRLADQIADLAPHRRLGDEVDVGVRIVLPALALENPSGLAAAGIVARARGRIAKRQAFAKLAVFGERARLEPLLVAQFYAAEVEHTVLHGGQHLLPAAGAVTLVERADDAEGEMKPGAAIADLRASDQRRSVTETRGRGRTARALRNVLVDLAILIRAGAEAFHRSHDHARIELVDVLPGEAHAIERAGGEILNEHIAGLDQLVEHTLALRMLGVDRDRALVVIEHREVERVGALHVHKLAACNVTHARALDLDHVGAEPGQQLGAGWT